MDKSCNQIDTKDIKVAVIIPVRNEERNLPLLLHSLAKQKYPLKNIQIIISDDHSTDNSADVAENFFKTNGILNGISLRSPKQSKKEAIAFAIAKTEAELILTTDADTFMDKDWISVMVMEYINSDALLICGPVKLHGENNFIERLQVAEFTGLSGIGASGIYAKRPMYCNGANLAFSRKIFNEIGGYEKSISFSGDDTQLMLKIHKFHPGRISFLKDSRAIVHTNVVKGNSDFLQQRQRWASKIPLTLSPFTVFISVMVWLVHAFLLIQLLDSLMQLNFLHLFLPFIMIGISEIIFLKIIGKFFDEKIPWRMIILAQPIYCIYIVFVGLFAPIGSYRWKGRKLR